MASKNYTIMLDVEVPIEAPYAEDCPDCPWDGKTTFTKEKEMATKNYTVTLDVEADEELDAAAVEILIRQAIERCPLHKDAPAIPCRLIDFSNITIEEDS